MILITDLKDYLEYGNSLQNQVCKIAGLLIDGNIDWLGAFLYHKLKPSYEDLFPIK